MPPRDRRPPRVRVVDGSKHLYCPACMSDDLNIELSVRTIEEKGWPDGHNKAELVRIPMEFCCGAQARYVCPRCGYGEVYLRDHKEHREANEERRLADEGPPPLP